jgi:beta-N-acetylhexosaminidase
MVSNASVPGLSPLPASLSPEVTGALLRQQLGFSGLVLTDDLSAGAVSQAGFDLPRAAVAAIGAGADMVLFGSTLTPSQTLLLSPEKVEATVNQIVGAIATAVQAGVLSASRLDDAVDHILQAKGVDPCAHQS